MQSSKILISSVLIVSAIVVPLLASNFITDTNQFTTQPHALQYSLSFTNLSVDLTVTSDSNAFLFIHTTLQGNSFSNKTTQLSTTQHFSFNYPNQTFTFSAALVTSSTTVSDMNYFIINKTVDQPAPFYINHSVVYSANTTILLFTTNSRLNLSSSFVNDHSSLTLLNSTPTTNSYSVPVTSSSNNVSLVDSFTRTYDSMIQVSLANLTTSQSKFNFTYSSVVNNDSVTFTINSSAKSQASITLLSSATTSSYSNSSSTQTLTHILSFSHLPYATYNTSLRVWNNVTSLTKHFLLTLTNSTLQTNQTTSTIPKIVTQSITTTLTTIIANFTFSEPVKANLTLSYTNGSSLTMVHDLFSTSLSQIFLVPIGQYNLTIHISNQADLKNTYPFSYIKTDQLDSHSYLSLHSAQSVLNSTMNNVTIFPSVVINGSQVGVAGNVSFSFARSGMVISHFTLPLNSTMSIPLDQASLSLYPTGVLTMSCTLLLYNLSFTQSFEYLLVSTLPQYQPDLSLGSYASNFTTGSTIAIHLHSINTLYTNQLFIDFLCPETGYSLGFFQVPVTGPSLDQDVFVTLPVTTLQYLILRALIYSPNNFNPTMAFIRVHLTYGLDTSSPALLGSVQTPLLNNSRILALTTSDPVSLQLFYGTTQTVLATSFLNVNYQSSFAYNLSSLMIQNATNYFYFVLTDSNGHSTTFDNNTHFFSVFVPKIDFQAPWNTTELTINSRHQLTFLTNEDVTVIAYCTDTAQLNTFVCANQSTFSQNFSLLLQTPFTGTTYILKEVKLTDKAGNSSVIALDMPFQT